MWPGGLVFNTCVLEEFAVSSSVDSSGRAGVNYCFPFVAFPDDGQGGVCFTG